MNAQFDGIPTGKFAFFIGVMCLKGSAIGALSALPYAMAADVIDLDSARTGKRQGGAYFSIWTMTRKLAYALGLVVGLYSIVPALFKFIAIPMLWRYPLTEEKLREVQQEIAAGKQTA